MVKKREERRLWPALREAMRAEEVLEVLRGRFHRPACALRLSQGPVTVFDSHFGGLPYCPGEGEPPVGEDGRQLRLMVQINFAQMHGSGAITVKYLSITWSINSTLSRFRRRGLPGATSASGPSS